MKKGIIRKEAEKRDLLKKSKWVRDSGGFRQGKWFMWVGTNNNLYLANDWTKIVVYKGKSAKDVGKMLQHALKDSPGNIFVPGWSWKYE
jgi:hypothetical protein